MTRLEDTILTANKIVLAPHARRAATDVSVDQIRSMAETILCLHGIARTATGLIAARSQQLAADTFAASEAAETAIQQELDSLTELLAQLGYITIIEDESHGTAA